MSDEQPPQKRHKAAAETAQTPSYLYDASDVVTLIVGEEQHKMAVHATSLTRNSDFFKAALKKERLEGQIKTIPLTEEDPELIAQYLDFTYGKPFPKKDLQDAVLETWREHYTLLARLFMLGERLIDKTFQHAAIAEFARIASLDETGLSGYIPDEAVARIIYDGTCKGSPARRLLVDIYLFEGTANHLQDFETLPKQFLLDITREIFDKVDREDRVIIERKSRFYAEDYTT